jgi:uncharacterized coiled-coil DUF342 family protein
MATKAKTTVKRTTLKDKFEYLQRERDQINRERIELVKEVDVLKRRIDQQANTIKLLQDQLDKVNNTSRHWVLRKLGL